MKRLQVEIECGETTCASSPYNLCRFARVRDYGSDPVCGLFPSILEPFTPLVDKNGWLQRCDACKEAERDAQETQP